MTCRKLVRFLACVATVFGSLWCNNRAFGKPVVLESAELGTTGRFGGTSVTISQFVGWRFQTNEALTVDRVGGHLLSFPDEPGDIFAALVRLGSIDSVPLGAPFTAEEVIATTTFRPPFPSDEVLVPLAATLTPGSYSLVLGTGLFGATGAGALHNGPDQPDIPPTDISSFIFWSIPTFGQPPEWRLNLASHMRFIVEAQAVNLPGDYNRDGRVDAADYVVWRINMDTEYALPNDLIGGTIGQAHYDQWRAHFGEMLGNVSGSGTHTKSAVPEPAALAMFLGGMLAMLGRRRSIRS